MINVIFVIEVYISVLNYLMFFNINCLYYLDWYLSISV